MSGIVFSSHGIAHVWPPMRMQLKRLFVTLSKGTSVQLADVASDSTHFARCGEAFRLAAWRGLNIWI
jgi:hypothetical protein